MLFIPRQVALASATAAAMAKEEPKREKKGKSKASKGGGGGASAALVASIAAFLEASGFPRTLAALQSEANLEGDAWKTSSPVSLEDLFSKFLASSDSTPGVGIAGGNEQENTANGVVEEEDAGKKKKKKKGGAEAVEPESKVSESAAPEKPSDNKDGETRENKQKKKKKDPSSSGNDGNEANTTVGNDDKKTDGKKEKSKKHDKDEDNEAKLDKVVLAIKNKFEAAEKTKENHKKSEEEEPKSHNDGTDKNGLGDGAHLDKGKKKKKGKLISETSDKVDAGAAPVKNEGKSNDAKQDNGAVEKGKDDNGKKGKKKRKKLDSQENASIEDKQVAGGDSVLKSDEKKSGMYIDKSEDGKPSTDDVVGKKRKLEEVVGSKTPAKEDTSAKQDNGAVEKGKDDNGKKGKKKRKKLDSQENASIEDKQVAGGDSVLKSDEKKSGMYIDKSEDGKPSTDDVVGKKRKLEEVVGSKTPAKEDTSAKLNNGVAEDDTKEHSALPRPNKRQKHSSEPKTVNPFQRVKLEDVKFADDRLQDNSYWAKGGADSGYGAKAQEVLGQVRGRGFRHEKTKKKRGTYRGGQIDLQTHSIKFDNSDDE